MNPESKPSNRQRPPDFVIQAIPRDMAEDPGTGWNRRIFFLGPTTFLDELCIHAGVLSGHMTPHPPHCHEHEEVHIALSGNLEFISGEEGSDIVNATPVDNCSIYFTNSKIPHSFRNAAPGPSAYLHLRWRGTPKEARAEGSLLKFYYSPAGLGPLTGKGPEVHEIFSGPSVYLSHLKAMLVRLPAGGSVPFHRHPHEVIFALISGSVEILGKKIDAPGFAFMGTRMPHHIINKGPGPAQFYAFELHQED